MSYKEAVEELCDTLEMQYLGAKAKASEEAVKDVLQKMIAFRVIERDDSRISEKALKELNGGEKMPFLRKDYRAEKVKSTSSFTGYVTTEFLPDNVFFGTIGVQHVKIRNRGYWGERRELQYRGDIIVPETEHDYTFRSEEEYSGATSALRSLETMMKRITKKDMDTKPLMAGVQSGQVKVCKIALENGKAFSVGCLGFIIITSVSRSKAKVRIYLDTEAMLRYRLVIGEAINRLSDALEKTMSDGINLEYIAMQYIEAAKKKQKDIASTEKPLNYDKFCDIENQTIEADGEPIIEN